MNKEIIIFTGGLLTDNLLDLVNRTDAIVIGVDRGAKWLIDKGIIPDYFVGDFDSVDKSFLQEIKIKYNNRVHVSPAEKDETDTELAVRLAVSLKPRRITILGGFGTRLDHVLANVHILLQAERENIEARLLGSTNNIRLLLPDTMKKIEKSSRFVYVSFLPFTELVEGITVKGFKYPLKNAKMKLGTPFGISNELIDSYGTISIEKGILLIIESKD